MTVAELRARWGAREIRDCPGRAILGCPSALGPGALLGSEIQPSRYEGLPTARDLVYIAALEDGGLISFLRPDGAWVHTLNTPSGFRRRLARFQLELPSGSG